MDTRGKSFNRSNVGEREAEIEHLLRKYGEKSRRQLAQELGVESNSVTAAARSLLNKGKIIETGIVFDQETKRHQRMLAINPNPVKVKEPKENKSWKISSLELELEQVKKERDTLKKRIVLLVHMMKYVSDRVSTVSDFVKEFQEIQAKGYNNESK